MKWNIAIGSMILGVGLCSQGYAFELLDRMLGTGGSCCESSCCETPTPCCKTKCKVQKVKCCEPKPACCEAPKPVCCKQPKVKCCEPKPVCCEAPKPVCCKQPKVKCCKPEPVCCEAPKPTCCKAPKPTCCKAPKTKCCKPACETSCCKTRHHCCLLHRIFAKRCCESSCGNGCNTCGSGHVIYDSAPAPAEAAAEGDMAPMPPAPVVDPQAFVPAARRVVPTSLIR